MLQVEHLYYQHNDKPILNDINFQLRKGELLTLLGANGAGKSTLLNCIAGLLKINQGKILWQNQSIKDFSPKQIAQRIAYVSQYAPQTYQYSVRDFVVLGRASHLGLFNRPSKADFLLVDNVLSQLNITKLANKIYMHCSGGEKQLVNISKVLVQQPELILFDEPTSALDYGNVFKTISLIRELADNQFSIIMTTHNPDHPILLHSRLPNSKTAILNQQGNLIIGNTPEIITEQNLNKLYQTELKLIQVPELNRKICAITHI